MKKHRPESSESDLTKWNRASPCGLALFLFCSQHTRTPPKWGGCTIPTMAPPCRNVPGESDRRAARGYLSAVPWLPICPPVGALRRPPPFCTRATFAPLIPRAHGEPWRSGSRLRGAGVPRWHSACQIARALSRRCAGPPLQFAPPGAPSRQGQRRALRAQHLPCRLARYRRRRSGCSGG